jgi:hypothetical protein
MMCEYQLDPYKAQYGHLTIFKVVEPVDHVERKKFIDRSPKMANILELKTKKGSEAMAKLAGTLSNAKRTSENSIITKAMNNGVAAVMW